MRGWICWKRRDAPTDCRSSPRCSTRRTSSGWRGRRTILQLGARNMQNFSLLKEVGRVDRPVLLKRGMMASIDEWLAAAEYILAHGNQQVILCERGIRTFETATRNTLDLSAVPVARERTHLPIIVDPSHACGTWRWVAPMAIARAGVRRARRDGRGASRAGQGAERRAAITQLRPLRRTDAANSQCRPGNAWQREGVKP